MPRLVVHANSPPASAEGNIWHCDFFAGQAQLLSNVDLVVGNPPWGSTADDDTVAAQWCAAHDHQIPDKQIAAAFMWKAVEHVGEDGRVCFVLPHGILFNHGSTAVSFQKAFVKQHTVQRVLNLTDFQNFLFSEARHPALVISYSKPSPNLNNTIEYWAPKSDWMVTKAEIITLGEGDRSTFTTKALLEDLDGEDAPQIWKKLFWATPRDRRLLDRLSLFGRLRDHVRHSNENESNDKPWLIAEGFQPFGDNDSPNSRKTLRLPTTLFIPATSDDLNLFLLEADCETKKSKEIDVRRLIRDLSIFRAPHVLITHGFNKAAYADFDVSFRHAIRGISGPREDRNLLIFLAAYLRSALAQYFLFHTASTWGVSRKDVRVEELLRLPFPLPESLDDPERAREIIKKVANLVTSAASAAQEPLADREMLVEDAASTIEPLIFEYFDILPAEKVLIKDTLDIVIPSFRPSQQRQSVPTINRSTPQFQDAYKERLCATLNGWSKRSAYRVRGFVKSSGNLGIGMVVLEKVHREDRQDSAENASDVLLALKQLREAVSTELNAFELNRSVKVFQGNRLYIVKPLGQRLLDADCGLERCRRDCRLDPHAYSGGRCMSIIGASDQWAGLIDPMLPEILQLVIATWREMPPPEPDEKEDNISLALCRRLCLNRTARGLMFQIRTQMLEIDPIPGEDFGRLDVVFIPLVPHEDIYFCLECKRLNVIKAGETRAYASEYVIHGMLRFVSGQYSQSVQHGGMLAYVLDGDINRAMANVERSIRRRRDLLRMEARGLFRESSILAGEDCARETHHQRAHDASLFRIHHLFMAVLPRSKS